ncbi:Nse4 C-terminal-domain-containing protein [Blyttiomyces helicus]|uniref:Non-structural maintenance of chromosomes element 4 n=1 Tax=Blyttiomyces helicus TaxID=388810 RepID=A0A4P9VVQ9_9FUNG|nr:Nse4 C-terminal-domain-containing protein [Blyttiomyces helicus]|eukprot:RKO83754.1 Nse4 C-terminal-domain-containing protein [Blyttiomyces helicus]
MLRGDRMDSERNRSGRSTAEIERTRPNTAEEQRKLKAGYRELQALAEGEGASFGARTMEREDRAELLKPENGALVLENLVKQNELFKNVKNTQDAALDSRLLVTTADIAFQRARRMKVDGAAFDINDFASKVMAKLNASDGDGRGADGDGVLDWDAVGRIAARRLRRSVVCDFMLGPLAVQHKKRGEIKRTAKLVKDKRDLVAPERLKDTDILRAPNETSTVVRDLGTLLEKVGPIPYFRFIVNPDSFSQTVENMFYFSFLIRDGTAQMYEEADGDLIIG